MILKYLPFLRYKLINLRLNDLFHDLLHDLLFTKYSDLCYLINGLLHDLLFTKYSDLRYLINDLLHDLYPDLYGDLMSDIVVACNLVPLTCCDLLHGRFIF